MLDLQDVFASTRNQSLKGYQANSKAIRRRPPLLPFPTTNCSSSHSFSLPKQNKIKQCQPHNIHSYNVCHSKDVFVFSKKTPKPEPTIRSVARKMWNSQDKLDSHDEVFLPNPNLKGKTYRILPKTSHGRRRNQDDKASPRSMSTNRTRKLSMRINPQPWQLGVDPIDFDNIF